MFFKNRHQLLKLGDFGLLRNVTDTKRSFQNGTLLYLAPEVVKESGMMSKTQSDCWSFGCIMYELFNLKLLIRGDSLEKLMEAIQSQEIPPIGIEEFQDLFSK